MLEFYYNQAKNDMNAAHLQEDFSQRDVELSSKLRKAKSNLQIDLAESEEQVYAMHQNLLALQKTIKSLKNEQLDEREDMEIADGRLARLKKWEKKAETAQISNAASIADLERMFRILRERKDRIKQSAESVASLIDKSNLQDEKVRKLETKKKSALQLIAGHLLLEENKAKNLERQGNSEALESQVSRRYLSDHGDVNEERDHSAYDFAKALILSNKASHLRDHLEKKYSHLQKLRVRQQRLMEQNIKQEQLLQHSLLNIDSIRQISSAMRTGEKTLEAQGSQISKRLKAIRRAFIQDQIHINRISTKERQTSAESFIKDRSQVLKRLNQLENVISMENFEHHADKMLGKRLDQAAQTHALSSDRLYRAAADAVRSAVQLLHATSALGSVAAQSVAQNSR